MIIHCLIIIQGFIMKNSKGILLRALLCFALSYFLCAQFITQPTVCSAKIYKVKEHKKPAGLKGEFIAYYDFQKKETTYYDKNEIPTKKFQKKMNYKPQKPDEKLIQRYKVKSVNTPTKLLNTNFTSDVNTTGTSLYSYLPDNRIKVSSSQINSFPYYSICKLTMTFPDSPGYVTLGTGYELWNKLCATAGHCLLNSNGKYFNSIKAEFGYNNGTCVYTATDDDLAGYVLHGEFDGKNWSPEIDYAFLHWNKDIANNVGHFGISWSYSSGNTCLSAGYPSDKENGEYLYKSTSTINSIDDCVIDSNNYCMPGQSGSPLYLPGGYAIGITSGNANDRSMFSVQLDNGITTWLNQNGYFD